MSTILQYLNLLGIVLLAGLLSLQWKANEQLRAGTADLERTGQAQAKKISDDENAIKGGAADLEACRIHLGQSYAALKEAQTKLTAETAEKARLNSQCDKYKATLDQWVAAVKGRDDALDQMQKQLLAMKSDRDAAVGKFNELVTKYNDVVKELNASQPRNGSGH